jgi:hypothetical protein
MLDGERSRGRCAWCGFGAHGADLVRIKPPIRTMFSRSKMLIYNDYSFHGADDTDKHEIKVVNKIYLHIGFQISLAVRLIFRGTADSSSNFHGADCISSDPHHRTGRRCRRAHTPNP